MEDSSNHFDQWNSLKKKLDSENHIPYFHERQIWWASIGKNIGHEQDGKNKEFSRPVLIFKKFNDRLFFGLPLTTKIKKNKHYHQFTFKGKEQCAILTQMRLWDANRLTRRMGQIGKKEFKNLKDDFISYIQ